MNNTVAKLMANQNGLVLRRQALEAGLEPRQIDRLVLSGTWIAVRRGVYATAAHWDALDEFVERPRLRAIAASRNMLVPHALSHDSAALLHRMPILLPKPELVHSTRWGHLGGRVRNGVKHHQAPFRPAQLVQVDGIWALDRARTAVDVAREHGERHGLVACDSALRLGVSREDLREAVGAMSCWPHVVRTRWCVENADDAADSVLESLGRLLVIGLGIGEVEPQFGLTDGRRIAWCDLRVGRHVIELDGRVKYRPVSVGGLAVDPDQARWEEKKRHDFISGFKLGISRLTYADLMPENWRATEGRVLREALGTRELFGDSIADLAPYIIPKPRRRG
jgi:hypothetical protein